MAPEPTTEQRPEPGVGEVTADRPEPVEDAVPDAAPGGSDAPEARNAPEAPQDADTPWGEPVTTDQPRAAHVEEKDVPDELDHSEGADEPETDGDGAHSTEEPSG